MALFFPFPTPSQSHEPTGKRGKRLDRCAARATHGRVVGATRGEGFRSASPVSANYDSNRIVTIQNKIPNQIIPFRFLDKKTLAPITMWNERLTPFDTFPLYVLGKWGGGRGYGLLDWLKNSPNKVVAASVGPAVLTGDKGKKGFILDFDRAFQDSPSRLPPPSAHSLAHICT